MVDCVESADGELTKTRPPKQAGGPATISGCGVLARYAFAMQVVLMGLALSCSTARASALDPPLAMDVLHYTARLDPDLANKTIRGRVEVSLIMMQPGARTIQFDAGDLTVDVVREKGSLLAFEKTDQYLRVDLQRPAVAAEKHVIEIEFHGAPRFGLEFHPERGELYTIFSTSQWLVCVDAPEDRATLDLSVALPAGTKATGNGRLVSKVPLDGQRELFRWRQDIPVPSYVYGFAAGRYVEATERRAGADLRYLATSLDASELHRIFADTGDMLRFFGRRSGVRYRGMYTQALVAETVGQEEATFSLMSEAYGRETLGDVTSESLIAHELAHQWWGNMVTCRNWNHFWLNEGFATFMAAAYVQHRFGDREYRKYIESWRTRWKQLRETGRDHPLVYEQWSNATADDRAVVYKKGAYVLHMLREEIGERAFWRGIRSYTRKNYGRSVTTIDFKQAMEHASKRNLTAFFDQWVDLPSQPEAASPTADLR
jgi:aminopeptidase N